MRRSTLAQRFASFLIVFAAVMLWSLSAMGYATYSQNDDATNCRACHGDFRSDNYISLTDGQNWGNLHNMHRGDILNFDCAVCHEAGSDFPVFLDDSDGGAGGMESIGCMGCHGRAEDNVPENPEFNEGYGAGLRQHHTLAGVGICQNCHTDANPASYTPVGEDVLPPYYVNPGTGHNIPNESCNSDGSENFRGAPEGLDNDGDNIYDTLDPDCGVLEGCFLNCPQGDGGLISAAGSGNKSPDIDGNGIVDVSDFAQFGTNFNGVDYCTDYNCDGIVDVSDFAVFGTHFNHGPGANGVCE